MHYMYQAMCARHVPSCVNISCAQAQLNNIFAHNIMNDNADFLVQCIYADIRIPINSCKLVFQWRYLLHLNTYYKLITPVEM